VRVMAEVGPGGCFLDHPHTLEHFRGLVVRGGVFAGADYAAREGRAGSEARDAVQRAHEKALALIAGYEQPPLDPGLRAEIEDYLKARRP